ncbi:MAG TPA: hypothetical protein VGA37_10960 [Gemmatimonadales bacterium]
MRDLTIVLSIDTEEDNWTPTRTGLSVKNVAALSNAASFMRRLGARPTFLATHAVITDPAGADVLRSLVAEDTEVGAHLHAWNTPPYGNRAGEAEIALGRLPPAVQQAKLETLTEGLTRVTGRPPTSFRGRFGMWPETAALLAQSGYEVDTTVAPCVDWRREGGSDFRDATPAIYRFDPSDPATPNNDGQLTEVPMSWGFNRIPMARWRRWHAALGGAPWRQLRLRGLMARTGLLRRISLNPERTSRRDMVALGHALLAEDVGHLHLVWHSLSHTAGTGPFVRTSADVSRLYARIETVLEAMAKLASLRFATVTEAARAMVPEPGGAQGGQS